MLSMLALGLVLHSSAVDARLISTVSQAVPGQPFEVGVRVRMDADWHIYYKNPGPTGMPTSVKWKLPAGWKASEIRWPVPKIEDLLGDPSYAYSGEILLIAELTPSATAGPISASVSWLECFDSCRPNGAEVSLPMALGAQASPSPDAAKFQEARQKWPLRRDDWSYEATLKGRQAIVTISKAGGDLPSDLNWIPSDNNLYMLRNPSAKKTPDGMTLTFDFQDDVKLPKRIRGLVIAKSGSWPGGREALGIDVPVR